MWSGRTNVIIEELTKFHCQESSIPLSFYGTERWLWQWAETAQAGEEISRNEQWLRVVTIQHKWAVSRRQRRLGNKHGMENGPFAMWKLNVSWMPADPSEKSMSAAQARPMRGFRKLCVNSKWRVSLNNPNERYTAAQQESNWML